jgi:hypothetical protein
MILDLLLSTAALTLLIFPGWRFAQRHALPLPMVAGFIIGAIGLVLWIFILQTLDWPLCPATVLPLGFAAVLATLILGKTMAPASNRETPHWRTDWPLLLPLIPALSVVAYRGISQPLFGADTAFRWNFLAERMLALRTLSFYPPVSSADYSIYGWPDGIPPLVSSLYLWVYLPAGTARPILTSPLIILQFLLLVFVCRALARRFGGERAAGFAIALLACGPLFIWAATMGHETGLTALALGALILYLPERNQPVATVAIIMAGLAAALGALAREYGIAFILFGFGLCLWRRHSSRTAALYLVVALGATLPWYLRNWVRTGNPLFNQAILDWFPVNDAYLVYMNAVRLEHTSLPPGAFHNFATTCSLALLATVGGLCFGFKRLKLLLASIALTTLLWGLSLPFTASGFTYSLRVLSPALLLAPVAGGVLCARWIPSRQNLYVAAFSLTLFSIDSAVRALVLPADPYRIPISSWLSVGSAIQDYHSRPIYTRIAKHVGRQGVLILGPHALLYNQGARVIPLWSPEVNYLWDATLDPATIARRLLASNIHFVLTNLGEINRDFLEKMRFFRPNPSPRLLSIWTDGDLMLFLVIPPADDALAPSPTTPAT